VQVLVYAGAIMVVFLFVVMLLNLGDGRRGRGHPRNRTRSRPARLGLVLLASCSCCTRRLRCPRARADRRGPTSAATGEVNVVAPVARRSSPTTCSRSR
jgi:NADH:ubiquinone oxidoreductase subunit 6 (subunit J)